MVIAGKEEISEESQQVVRDSEEYNDDRGRKKGKEIIKIIRRRFPHAINVIIIDIGHA